MSDAKVRGRFVWHEMMTTDPQAAAAFYTQVVGWKTQQWPQNPSYTLLVARDVPMAGLMALPEELKTMGVPPHWLSYIGTPNVDETAHHAERLGGVVLKEPMDIPDVGRFVVIRDPQGAVFAAFKPTQAPPGDMKPTLGDFSWHELVTTDWQSAFDFYSALFGWEKTESMDMGPEMGIYQMYGWKGDTLGGMFNKPASMPAPPHWMPYALVPDSKRAAEVTKRNGGQILNGPMEVPGGDWIAQGMDPLGAAFAVHSRKPVETAAEPEMVAKPKAARKRAASSTRAKPKAKKRAATKAKSRAPAKRRVKRGAVKKRSSKRSSRPKARRAASRKRIVKRAAKRRPAKETKTKRSVRRKK